ncbi:MAG TPA: SRPBCC family protein [Chloroflexota bacterium]|nr:SRPBCC family protein [Chloroflexota bacterium]
MEFTNSFTVAASAEQVWSLLTQIEEVVPCVPNAQVTEMLSDNRFRGLIKIKLGPVQMSYRGEMTMEANEAARTIVLQGKGTAQGQGNAAGTVTVHVQEGSDGTDISVVSQVDVTGRVATFGRGIMQDVANRLVREFAQCLQQKLAAPSDAENRAAPEDTAPLPDAEPGGPEPVGAGTAGGPPAAPAPISASPPTSQPPPSGEVRVLDLLADVAKARLAEGLRALADRIDPS